MTLGRQASERRFFGQLGRQASERSFFFLFSFNTGPPKKGGLVTRTAFRGPLGGGKGGGGGTRER
jgi:hypothetical protein